MNREVAASFYEEELIKVSYIAPITILKDEEPMFTVKTMPNLPKKLLPPKGIKVPDAKKPPVQVQSEAKQ